MKRIIHATTIIVLLLLLAPLQGYCSGKLFLIGIGPGDPDLASIRAVNTARTSDILIYCEKDVPSRFGKYMKGKRTVEAPLFLWRFLSINDPSKCPGNSKECVKIVSERNRLIKEIKGYLSQGKTVSILSDGDPLIYGPWSWITRYFNDVNVIPGMSCFNAALAALRRDLTYAPKTKSIIITANDWPGKVDTITKLSKIGASMVIFTMGAKFNQLIEKLSQGYSPNTPIAVVMFAGYNKKQKVIRGTLKNIRSKVNETTLPFQYLIVVGKALGT